MIEDAAEMHGQTYKGKLCGSFGDISTFSFYPNKHITTGEGGMIMVDNLELSEQCRKLRNLAFEANGPRFIHQELGWNYRMTNMQAALGLAQLENIENHILKKREIGLLYNERFKNIKGFQKPLATNESAKNIYWVFGLVAETQQLCENTVKMLNENNIATRPFFWCMHEQPVFKKMELFGNEKYLVAEKMARNGFYLPSGLGITKDEQELVAKKLNQILK